MKEYAKIRIKASTKERLDILKEHMGLSILEIVDRATSYFQVHIIRLSIEKEGEKNV